MGDPGGVEPYTLTVDGASVDADATSVNATCGTLPEPGDGEDPVTEAPGTITATVTDATGAPATASAAYTIVPPLPAPTAIYSAAYRTFIGLDWDRVDAAGPVPALGAECPCPLYLLRWRVAGTETWTTGLHADRQVHPGQAVAGRLLLDLFESTTYELAVATLRDAIEQDTPAALTWSAPVTMHTLAPPTGVRATATHDTVTVTWDPQPGVRVFAVTVWGPHGATTTQQFTPDGSTPHQLVFRDLPPDTEYRVEVRVPAGQDSVWTEITVATSTPPADWTPLPRGPQNLRTSVTHDSVTVDWDAPHTGAGSVYHVNLHPPVGLRQSVAVHSGVTEHTFTGLAPATTYEVAVIHADIVVGRVEVAVTTLAAPTAGGGQRSVRATLCHEILPGWLVCPPADAGPAALHYNRLDPTGQATTPGSYAFLDAAGRAVTTYEGLRDGTTTALCIHQSDGYGASQADTYGDVAVGDIFEWREADDCWVRYEVTEVKAAGTAPRKEFAVKWHAYAFTGCAGTVATDNAVRVTVDPPSFFSPRISTPVRYGPYQLVPYGWTGVLEETTTVAPPSNAASGASGSSESSDASDGPAWPSSDPASARQHPLWNEPSLPAGWTLGSIWAEESYVEAHYRDDRGYGAAHIWIARQDSHPRQLTTSVLTGHGNVNVEEERIVDGHAAIVMYDAADAVVFIFNAVTGVEYFVHLYSSSADPNGRDVDDAIALARSLYQ